MNLGCLIWTVLTAIWMIYLVVFHACVTYVLLKNVEALHRVPEDHTLALQILTRITIAFFWPFAIVNGELWHVVIKGEI